MCQNCHTTSVWCVLHPVVFLIVWSIQYTWLFSTHALICTYTTCVRIRIPVSTAIGQSLVVIVQCTVIQLILPPRNAKFQEHIEYSKGDARAKAQQMLSPLLLNEILCIG